MNTKVRATRYVPAMETMEGAGVTVHRTIGTPALRNYDPFMLLDQISSDNPDEYIAGFPSHPHRGFNTFTYMIDGDMEHKDCMGNTGNLGLPLCLFAFGLKPIEKHPVVCLCVGRVLFPEMCNCVILIIAIEIQCSVPEKPRNQLA